MLFATLLLAGFAATMTADELKMDHLMGMKLEHWSKMRAEGMFDSNRVASGAQKVPCSGGKAGEYLCDHVDLLSFLSHEDMGSTTREGNDVWGTLAPGIPSVDTNYNQVGHLRTDASLEPLDKLMARRSLRLMALELSNISGGYLLRPRQVHGVT